MQSRSCLETKKGLRVKRLEAVVEKDRNDSGGCDRKKPKKELNCSGDRAATEREVYNAGQRSGCYSNP